MKNCNSSKRGGNVISTPFFCACWINLINLKTNWLSNDKMFLLAISRRLADEF